MFNYQAYGLRFTSELEWAGVPVAENDGLPPEVTIRLGIAPTQIGDRPFPPDTYFQIAPRQILLHFQDIARYLVSDGAEIVVDPSAGAMPEEVRLFLLGSAMGAVLYQRSLFPLHASAVETPWGVMAFTGPPGIGKSTLAAHLQRRGYPILSDDVCAICRDETGRPLVLPAIPHSRLCPDALERLGQSVSDYRRAKFDVDKYVVPISGGYAERPAELCRIHLLKSVELPEPAVRPVFGFDRIDQLMANLYRPEYLQGLATRGAVMRLAVDIASQVEVVEVEHDRDPARIEELICRLEAEWQTADSTRRKHVA